MLEIRKTRSSARHPQGNGQVERFNRTLIKMIRAYIQGDQEEWDLHLSSLTAAYRATPHESTKFTPNMLMLGREVRLPYEITLNSSIKKSSESTAYGDYIESLRNQMEKAHDMTRKYLQSNAKRHKVIHDTKLNAQNYQVGDQVWYLNEIRKEGVSPKLLRPYTGPCVIIQKMNNLDFYIQLDKKGTKRLVHHNKLKPYVGVSTPKWIRELVKKFK